MKERFTLNAARGKVMGVCAGLSDYTGIDVLVVRLALIVATLMTGPVAVLLYILTGWLASNDRQPRSAREWLVSLERCR